mmetsp:Transcript_20510/g.43479  ORF Transcript_20510/g.43479 Transcript_20510/m.43479 type:complete len:287 (+) Transcript_20510:1229-2089(+)
MNEHRENTVAIDRLERHVALRCNTLRQNDVLVQDSVLAKYLVHSQSVYRVPVIKPITTGRDNDCVNIVVVIVVVVVVVAGANGAIDDDPPNGGARHGRQLPGGVPVPVRIAIAIAIATIAAASILVSASLDGNPEFDAVGDRGRLVVVVLIVVVIVVIVVVPRRPERNLVVGIGIQVLVVADFLLIGEHRRRGLAAQITQQPRGQLGGTKVRGGGGMGRAAMQALRNGRQGMGKGVVVGIGTCTGIGTSTATGTAIGVFLLLGFLKGSQHGAHRKTHFVPAILRDR